MNLTVLKDNTRQRGLNQNGLFWYQRLVTLECCVVQRGAAAPAFSIEVTQGPFYSFPGLMSHQQWKGALAGFLKSKREVPYPKRDSISAETLAAMVNSLPTI